MWYKLSDNVIIASGVRASGAIKKENDKFGLCRSTDNAILAGFIAGYRNF